MDRKTGNNGIKEYQALADASVCYSLIALLQKTACFPQLLFADACNGNCEIVANCGEGVFTIVQADSSWQPVDR